MDSMSTEDPPHSNEEWFNQESSMILNEQLEHGKHQSENGKENDTTSDSPKDETNKNEIARSMNADRLSEENVDHKHEMNKDSEVISKGDFSPDELESGSGQVNELVPSGCEMTSPEFNDDQDVEIINAFKQGNLVIVYVVCVVQFHFVMSSHIH